MGCGGARAEGELEDLFAEQPDGTDRQLRVLLDRVLVLDLDDDVHDRLRLRITEPGSPTPISRSSWETRSLI